MLHAVVFVKKHFFCLVVIHPYSRPVSALRTPASLPSTLSSGVFTSDDSDDEWDVVLRPNNLESGKSAVLFHNHSSTPASHQHPSISEPCSECQSDVRCALSRADKRLKPLTPVYEDEEFNCSGSSPRSKSHQSDKVVHATAIIPPSLFSGAVLLDVASESQDNSTPATTPANYDCAFSRLSPSTNFPTRNQENTALRNAVSSTDSKNETVKKPSTSETTSSSAQEEEGAIKSFFSSFLSRVPTREWHAAKANDQPADVEIPLQNIGDVTLTKDPCREQSVDTNEHCRLM